MTKKIGPVFIWTFIGLFSLISGECHSQVYCSGKMLDILQRSQIFDDSKTLVDMPLRYAPKVVLEAFGNLADHDRETLEAFIRKYFAPVGDDIEDIKDPSDWIPNPPFLDHISDPNLKSFGGGIHDLWRNLTKSINHTEYCSECYSSIEVPFPFVVAGDRFREYYYWDTFWIIKGLLVSGMINTTKGMLLNMMSLVEQYGFVPNGGRVYYLNRSQPPVLTQIVHEYVQTTGDYEFLSLALPILDKEYQFWMKNRTIFVHGYELNRYHVENKLPRPEAYLADVNATEGMDEKRREKYYEGVATAAESGQDFSSEWFRKSFNQSTIETERVVPVCLNSMMLANEITLYYMHSAIGNETTAKYYRKRSSLRWSAIQDLMWNEGDLQWYDFNVRSDRQDDRFYATNWLPLWTVAYTNFKLTDRLPDDFSVEEFRLSPSLLKKILDNMMYSEEAFHYPAGVPTSLFNTSEQWDFPNVWAPLMFYLVEGIRNINTSDSRSFSLDLVDRWISTSYCGWKNTGFMFEK
eukprot:TRINITY_DN9234_c0_g1_i1.p1 TRINITY_DN9234_c0_g1~~TRINITY_DN9234_c0_g1_i1.p1  ORF type:complete len:520 (-),score=132.10 TRINITY_DN9234_c0_g1_i1:221-1780(-)